MNGGAGHGMIFRGDGFFIAHKYSTKLWLDGYISCDVVIFPAADEISQVM